MFPHDPDRTIDQPTSPADVTLAALPSTAVSDGAAGTLISTAPAGYDLLEEVGRGGMGVVWRARARGLNRDVAVKPLADKFAPDSAAARRFLDEARITGQLQHPGVPAVHQVGTLP